MNAQLAYDNWKTHDVEGEAADLAAADERAEYELWSAERPEWRLTQSYADFLLAQQLFDAWEAWDRANWKGARA